MSTADQYLKKVHQDRDFEGRQRRFIGKLAAPIRVDVHDRVESTARVIPRFAEIGPLPPPPPAPPPAPPLAKRVRPIVASNTVDASDEFGGRFGRQARKTRWVRGEDGRYNVA